MNAAPSTAARSHSDIISDGGGPAAIARMVSANPGTVKQWRRTDSIPAPYWVAFVDADLASLEELAMSAARRIERSGPDEPGLHGGDPSAVDEAVVAPAADAGADNPARNVSRTEVAA